MDVRSGFRLAILLGIDALVCAILTLAGVVYMASRIIPAVTYASPAPYESSLAEVAMLLLPFAAPTVSAFVLLYAHKRVRLGLFDFVSACLVLMLSVVFGVVLALAMQFGPMTETVVAAYMLSLLGLTIVTCMALSFAAISCVRVTSREAMSTA